MTINDLKFGDYIYFDGTEPFIYIGNGNCQRPWSAVCVSFQDITKSSITKIQRYVPYKVHEIRRTEKGTNYTINGGDKGVDNVFRLETIYERKEILDDKEKEYLSAVIKPFKHMVKYILKDCGTTEEYISIGLKNNEYLNFPYFKSGKMYKGMQLDKKYSLEELGL